MLSKLDATLEDAKNYYVIKSTLIIILMFFLAASSYIDSNVGGMKYITQFISPEIFSAITIISAIILGVKLYVFDKPLDGISLTPLVSYLVFTIVVTTDDLDIPFFIIGVYLYLIADIFILLIKGYTIYAKQ